MLKLATLLIMTPLALFMVITLLLSMLGYWVWPLLIVGLGVLVWRRVGR